MDGRIVWFGMHKGKKWDDVPVDYLKWVVRTFDRGMAKSEAKKSLKKRSGKWDIGEMPDCSHPNPDPSLPAPWEGEDSPEIAEMRMELAKFS